MATTDVNSYVFREQGSTKLTVASGGMIDIKSGGELEVKSGGILDLNSGHKIYFKGYTTHATTADGRLANYGHSFIKPTSSGIQFRMSAPVAGCEKFITLASSKRTIVSVTTASGQKSPYFGLLSTDAVTIIKHLGVQGRRGNTVHLRGKSTIAWWIVNAPSTLSVAFSTTT